MKPAIIGRFGSRIATLALAINQSWVSTTNVTVESKAVAIRMSLCRWHAPRALSRQ